MFKDGASNWPRTLQVVTIAVLIALGSLVALGLYIGSTWLISRVALGLMVSLAALVLLTIYIADKAQIQAKEVEAANRKLKDEIEWRRLIETALMEKELQMRSVMESASDAIISVNERGKIISWNKGAENIFGYAEEEALSQPLTLLMPERFRELHSKGFKSYLKTGEARVIGKTLELEGLRKNGSLFPLELSLGVWEVGEEKFFSGIARDITERKTSERVNAFFASIVESSDDAIYSHNLKTEIISWNAGAEKIYGYTAEEVMGHPVSMLVPPELKDEVPQILERLKRGERVEHYETVRQRKDGERIYVWLMISPIKNSDGHIIAASTIARDITEHKRTEEERHRFNALVRTITETTPDLIYVKDRDGRMLFANPATLRDSGKTLDQVIGKNEFEWHDNLDEVTAIQAIDQRVMGSGKTETLEETLTGPKGTRFYLSTKSPMYDNEGDVIGIIGLSRDITERKKEEEARAFLASIVASSEDAIYGTSLEGQIISWNTGAENIYGYRAEEVIGQPVSILIPDELKDEFTQIRERIKRSDKTINYETIRQGKDGKRVHVSLTVTPVKNADGQVIAGATIARDITEQKQIEEELYRINTLLKTISETTPDPIYVKDRDGRILFANPATLEVIGKTAEEVIGRSEFDWHDDPKEAAAFRANDLRIMESGKTEIIEEVSTGPEGTRFFLSTKSPMRDEQGEVIGIIGVSHNITGRKWAEDALKESEMRLQRLFESAPDAILVVNSEGRIKRVNTVAERMFSYNRDELLGQPIEMLIPEKFRELHLDHRAKYHAKQSLREMGTGLDVYAERKDGSTFPVSVMLSPLSQDEAGDVIAIAHDITERKQAEEKISQSLVEKESLLKEIHHRVKNNMQVISSLLSLQSGYVTDPEALRTFEESQQRVQAMALIHEKLYLTQDLSKIDFAEYINDLATSIFATYSVNTEAVALKINADRAFLKVHSAIPCSLIINELVTNSIKYAFPNGKQGEIYIGFHKETDGKHILTIGDNGVGLPADLDIETADSLGLRLVNILVSQLEGSLEMNNDYGAEFKISFQMADKE